MRASTTACTTAIPRKSAQPWANRLARWRWRSTCGRSSRTRKLGALAREEKSGADADASVSQVSLAESVPPMKQLVRGRAGHSAREGEDDTHTPLVASREATRQGEAA